MATPEQHWEWSLVDRGSSLFAREGYEVGETGGRDKRGQTTTHEARVGRGGKKRERANQEKEKEKA